MIAGVSMLVIWLSSFFLFLGDNGLFLTLAGRCLETAEADLPLPLGIILLYWRWLLLAPLVKTKLDLTELVEFLWENPKPETLLALNCLLCYSLLIPLKSICF